MVKKTATPAMKIMVQGPQSIWSTNEAMFNIGSNTLTFTIHKKMAMVTVLFERCCGINKLFPKGACFEWQEKQQPS